MIRLLAQDENGRQFLVEPVETIQEFLDYFTLDAADITNKFVTLTTQPTTVEKSLVDVVRGCTQKYGTDFIVAGDVLSWDGLGLETGLVLGDTLRVHYTI